MAGERNNVVQATPTAWNFYWPYPNGLFSILWTGFWVSDSDSIASYSRSSFYDDGTNVYACILFWYRISGITRFKWFVQKIVKSTLVTTSYVTESIRITLDTNPANSSIRQSGNNLYIGHDYGWLAFIDFCSFVFNTSTDTFSTSWSAWSVVSEPEMITSAGSESWTMTLFGSAQWSAINNSTVTIWWDTYEIVTDNNDINNWEWSSIIVSYIVKQ